MYTKLKSPLSVQLELTGECNHTCQHCYNFWRDRKEDRVTSNEISLRLSKDKALYILKKLSDEEVFSVVFTGGEPLLDLALCLDCIKFARLQGLEVNMNSNLTPLTEEGARGLKKAGLNHVLTSILGPNASVHDSITQHKNSFNLLLKKIKIAQDAGIRVTANMVVSQLNSKYVRSTARLVSKLGIVSFTATKAGKPGNCSDFSSLELEQASLVRLLNDLCWINSNLGMRVDILEPVPLCTLVGVKRPELFTSRRCNAGITTMTISCDGFVRPCSHLDISYGNIFTEEISLIWEKMNMWKQGTQVPHVCKSCSLFPICGSGCRMEGKSRTGEIDGLDPYTRISNVHKIESILKKRRCCETKKIDISSFKIAKFKTREEDFGGVMSFGGNKRILFDHQGFKVMSQLKPETIYKVSGTGIDWGSLDPCTFISKLLSHGVVMIEERG